VFALRHNFAVTECGVRSGVETDGFCLEQDGGQGCHKSCVNLLAELCQEFARLVIPLVSA
jgi:hypothetical protein